MSHARPLHTRVDAEHMDVPPPSTGSICGHNTGLALVAQIQELFEKLDGDASGLLDRQEVFRLINMLSGDELSQEGLDAAMNVRRRAP